MKGNNKNMLGRAFDFTLIKRTFSYVKPYKNKFVTAIIITLSLSALTIFRPLVVKYTLDEYIVAKQSNMLLIMTLILLSGLILEAVLQFANLYITNLIGQNIIKDLREKVFSHIVHFNTKYFDNTPVGTLVTRAVSDIESLVDVFSQGFIVILGDIFTLVVFVCVMFYVNWQMAFIVLLTVPLLIIATRFFKNGVKSSFTNVRNAVASLNTFVQEHIQGMKIVQIFNKEDEEFRKFEAINEKHKKANIRSIWYYSVFFPVVEILSSVSIGLLICYAGYNMGTLNVSPGEITFFLMLTNMLFRPIRMLADRLNTLQMGIVSSERVFKILDTEQSIENSGTFAPVEINGDLEFKNVSFSYTKDSPILKKINFKVKQGNTIAIVGTTGAGKSTIVNLLGRFYEYDAGEILIDGRNIREYDLNYLREKTGIVLQDVFLFSASIYDNITLFNSEIKEEKIIEASKSIGLHDFIMSLPGNYHFNVGERGNVLSAGQKQLIAFLRAYVYNPAILILDEATAAVDTQTEMLIQKAIEKITENRTSIIIAHRLATVKKADSILVMENGMIVEEGDIQTLLNQNGKFKALYDFQFQTNESVT